MPPHLSPQIRQIVRARARYMCEYCHTSEQWQYIPFTIDHIFPTSHGGLSVLSNLALACFRCNRQKSNRLSAVDPLSNEEVPLYNPRQDDWAEHFIWSADKRLIIDRTPIGRATTDCLQFNRERIIRIREADIAINRHPPEGDPIQEVEGK